MITAIIDIDYDDMSGWAWAVYTPRGNDLIGCSYGFSTRDKARQEAVKCLEEYIKKRGDVS